MFNQFDPEPEQEAQVESPVEEPASVPVEEQPVE